MSTSPAATLRRRLVDSLRQRGVILGDDVARAFLTVPRELFVPGVQLTEVYRDQAITTKERAGVPVSSSSQPAMMAVMLRQLDVRPGMRVLEIGAGTGYNAALLRELTGDEGQVTTVEIDPEIVAWARQRLDRAGYSSVAVVQADGASGWPSGAPYDRIELTVGAADIAPAWVDQLLPGGILVIPLWINTVQLCIAFEKQGGFLRSRSATPCGFMRIRGRLAGDDQYRVLQPNVMVATGSPEPVDDLIRQCLATEPLRETVEARSWHGFATYLALRDRSTVMLSSKDEHLTGFDGPTFGLVDPDDGSLCLLTFPMEGSGAATLRAYGGAVAEERLKGALQRWREAGSPDVSATEVSVYPPGTAVLNDDDATVVDTEFWRLVFRFEKS